MKIKFHKKRKKTIFILAIIILFFIIFLFFSNRARKNLIATYNSRESNILRDRNGEKIFLQPNSLGNYAEYLDALPKEFVKLLLQKEDKYFYYHPGVNPISAIRAFKNHLLRNQNIASSTITQQLVKILLSNEQKRTLKNKLTELFYALSLELYLTKEEILTMYCNSIFLGNDTQGIYTASRLYFDSAPDLLTNQQIVQLLAGLSNPTSGNPFTIQNPDLSQKTAKQLNIEIGELKEPNHSTMRMLRKNFDDYRNGPALFELNSILPSCSNDCALTIDQDLTKNVREILYRNVLSLIQKNGSNGAVVIIKLTENELLAILGSPNPTINDSGYKINMATKPRPIGSTVKPFIYLKGFEKNLRPYTFVEDKEYKYTIGTGFAFYPKNYDYQYHGTVTLHYALSNSLNVPTVKVLEYVGLDDFYNFLTTDLEFKPVQEIENYELGIALGGLEMDLLNLAYYFTIFANKGELRPLRIYQNKTDFPKISNINFSQNKKIAPERYIQLINKILSDRKTGVEQFGIKSNLNLFTENYAVKTGTSREFHDSWTIGYTPDFLVAVWVGNSQNEPMDKISGQGGSGRIWQEVMNLIFNSKYNKNTPFGFDLIKEFNDGENIQYGLKGDDFETYQNLLENNDLILTPHDGDIFLLEKNTQIPLKAREEAEWFIDDELLGAGQEVIFAPSKKGEYLIRAVGSEKEEKIGVVVEEDR